MVPPSQNPTSLYRTIIKHVAKHIVKSKPSKYESIAKYTAFCVLDIWFRPSHQNVLNSINMAESGRLSVS